MTCKCGVRMALINRSWIAAADDYWWECPLRHWLNFWKHTAPVKQKQ